MSVAFALIVHSRALHPRLGSLCLSQDKNPYQFLEMPPAHPYKLISLSSNLPPDHRRPAAPPAQFALIDRPRPLHISFEFLFRDAQIDESRLIFSGSDKSRHIVGEFQAAGDLSREAHMADLIRRLSVNVNDLKNVVREPELRAFRLLRDMGQREAFVQGLLICGAASIGKRVGALEIGRRSRAVKSLQQHLSARFHKAVTFMRPALMSNLRIGRCSMLCGGTPKAVAFILMPT